MPKASVSITDSGITTDSRGYAVVPCPTLYRRNDIGLNSKTLRDDTDIILYDQ